jgi:alginate O-acetyltransferase complex protein AlgI
MAFNSYAFLLLFLPCVVCLYWAASWSRGASPRLVVLILATLAFYAIAAGWALPFLLGSIAINFTLSRLIGATSGGRRSAWLTVGVGGNVVTLIVLKYAGFLASNVGALVGGGSGFTALALPLGVSFFTFSQIAFLVDTAQDRVGRARLLTYAASILFFPTIVSGPITYFREFAPQVEATPDRRRIPGDLLTGLVQLAIGLFKKVVIADTLALWVDPLFTDAAAGRGFDASLAWTLILGYLLQLYFDFSGYTDMAMGCARMLGIRLPPNFHSPLRATSIIDWWRRWHMSLGRFVGTYVFQPLALPLTRFAATRGYSRRAMLACGVLVPTFVSATTM